MTELVESRGYKQGLLLSIVVLFVFGRRQVADRLEQTQGVVPVDPLEGRLLDVVESTPGSPASYDLRLVEADHGLGQGVVVGVAPAAH